MSKVTLLSIACVLIGASVMSSAAARARSIPSMLTGKRMRSRWRVLHALMVFFLLGYAATLFVLWGSNHQYLELITGVVFLFGSGFVFLAVSVGHDSIAELETRVAERTQKLTKARLQAESANLAKSEFIGNMSHELKTPLNAIIGFGQLMRDQTFGPLNTKQERYIDNILSSSEHLLGLINRVLDLSKIGAGELAPVSLAKITKDAFERLKGLAEDKDVSLLCEVEGLPEIMGDGPSLRQVVIYLVENAIKYSEQGGEVKVEGEVASSQVCLTISDAGVGIDPADQARVFQEFEQVLAADAPSRKGAGLGLFLAKALVEIHRGTITVKSSGIPGEGCSFVVCLPALSGV